VAQGQGGRTKRPTTTSNREGRYTFDGYNLTLNYDNRMVKRFPTFQIGDDFSSIWFEGGDLSRKLAHFRVGHFSLRPIRGLS
jgi:hypothetical protein